MCVSVSGRGLSPELSVSVSVLGFGLVLVMYLIGLDWTVLEEVGFGWSVFPLPPPAAPAGPQYQQHRQRASILTVLIPPPPLWSSSKPPQSQSSLSLSPPSSSFPLLLDDFVSEPELDFDICPVERGLDRVKDKYDAGQAFEDVGSVGRGGR